MTTMVQALEVVFAFLLVYGVGPGLYVLGEQWWRRRRATGEMIPSSSLHRQLARLERQAANELLTGVIDRATYQRAMAQAAADDQQWQPPLVPGA